MFLHDVKIGTKLFLAFGFFIVLMVVSASLSLMSLNRANNGMQSIIGNDYPTTVKANQLIDNFQEFISTQQLMLLDDQGTYTAQSQQHLKAISERITVILGDLNNALPDGKSQRVLADILGCKAAADSAKVSVRVGRDRACRCGLRDPGAVGQPSGGGWRSYLWSRSGGRGCCRCASQRRVRRAGSLGRQRQRLCRRLLLRRVREPPP